MRRPRTSAVVGWRGCARLDLGQLRRYQTTRRAIGGRVVAALAIGYALEGSGWVLCHPDAPRGRCPSERRSPTYIRTAAAIGVMAQDLADSGICSGYTWMARTVGSVSAVCSSTARSILMGIVVHLHRSRHCRKGARRLYFCARRTIDLSCACSLCQTSLMMGCLDPVWRSLFYASHAVDDRR